MKTCLEAWVKEPDYFHYTSTVCVECVWKPCENENNFDVPFYSHVFKTKKIDRWQVIFDAPIEKKDVEPWRARKCWQNLSFGDTSKKRLAEEIDFLTPNSKFKRTVEGLKSPSNRTDSQSSQ